MIKKKNIDSKFQSNFINRWLVRNCLKRFITGKDSERATCRNHDYNEKKKQIKKRNALDINDKNEGVGSWGKFKEGMLGSAVSMAPYLQFNRYGLLETTILKSYMRRPITVRLGLTATTA